MNSDHGEDRTDVGNLEVPDALIIAAGKGSRIAERGDLKPLIPVLDVPLIERVISAGIESGLRRFWTVTGYRREELCVFLDDLRQRFGEESGDASLSDGIRWLGKRRRVEAHDIGGLFWMDVVMAQCSI